MRSNVRVPVQKFNGFFYKLKILDFQGLINENYKLYIKIKYKLFIQNIIPGIPGLISNVIIYEFN